MALRPVTCLVATPCEVSLPLPGAWQSAFHLRDAAAVTGAVAAQQRAKQPFGSRSSVWSRALRR